MLEGGGQKLEGGCFSEVGFCSSSIFSFSHDLTTLPCILGWFYIFWLDRLSGIGSLILVNVQPAVGCKAAPVK